MGAVAIDIHAKERALEFEFPIYTEDGVAKLLEDIHHVREMRFLTGDFGACDLLMDLRTALDNILMSKTQERILYYHYELGLTQAEVVTKLKRDGITITQQGVSINLKAIHRRIAKFHKEGVIVE